MHRHPMSDVAVSWIMLAAMLGLAWLLTTLDGPALLGLAASAVVAAAAPACRIIRRRVHRLT